MQRAAFFFVSTAALVLACSSQADDATSPPAPQPTADATPSAVSWEPCSLYSEGGSAKAECATIPVPLDRKQPDGKTIPFFVKRYRGAGGTGKIALWMLQGGPGGSGYVFERIAEAMATKFPDVDYYMPDHRGTGRSEKLTCTQQEATSAGGLAITPEEWPACLAEVQAKWGQDLAHFSTTGAASDVVTVATRLREEGQQLSLYGVSYGTYWALRILQLAPTGFDRVVLDSVAPPGSSLARQDQDADEAAHDLLRACGTDPECSAKLGPDPAARADALVTKLRGGHCAALKVPASAEGLSLHAAVRLAVGSLLMQHPYRAAIFPFLYRLDRCADADVAPLQHFLDAVYGGPPPGTPDPMLEQFGFVLSNNIAFSELWESPSPTAEDLAAIRDRAVASREITTDMVQERNIWPLYAPDEYVGGWPDASTTPVLTLAGGFDPATLLRKQTVVKDRLTGPGRHFVVVPSATHAVISSSPTTENRSCGTRIMMSFLADPNAPDTSCLATVVPTAFTPDPKLAAGLFGGPAWD